MEKFKRYVVLGSVDKHIDRGVRYLEWFTWGVLIFAAVVFGPVVINIFFGR